MNHGHLICEIVCLWMCGWMDVHFGSWATDPLFGSVVAIMASLLNKILCIRNNWKKYLER